MAFFEKKKSTCLLGLNPWKLFKRLFSLASMTLLLISCIMEGFPQFISLEAYWCSCFNSIWWQPFYISGEIYVAFFNLNAKRTVISAKLSDLTKAVHGKNVKTGTCKCREVWTEKDMGVLKETISMEVEMHGSALLVLNCWLLQGSSEHNLAACCILIQSTTTHMIINNLLNLLMYMK